MCTVFSASHQIFFVVITKVVKPMFYHEAMKDPRWSQAMALRIIALENNKTRTIETLLKEWNL